MPKFATYNDSNIHTGMYFCSDEEVTSDIVKFGTFESAEDHCAKILTPKICDNQDLADAIRGLALKAQERYSVSHRLCTVL